MKLVVRPQHLTNELEFVQEAPSLVAGLVKGRLMVVGQLPYAISKYVSADDLNGLTGEPAESFFYILAASKYGPYDSVELDGVTVEDIVVYLENSFSTTESSALKRGILPKSLVTSLQTA